LCRSIESKNKIKDQGSLVSDRVGIQGSLVSEGIEALSNVLQMLLPFPAQMIEQMAENFWSRLESSLFV
jgi:hypothetical protein